MGGNKTPIIDEGELFSGEQSWVESYHEKLLKGHEPEFTNAPSRLRRLTVDEALRIQTFPNDYEFVGGNSSVYKQIGNAVPCLLAYAVAQVAEDIMLKKVSYGNENNNGQHLLAV